MLEERKKVQMLKQYEEAGGKSTVSEKPQCAHCDKPSYEEKTCFQKYGRSIVSKAANTAGGGTMVASKCPIYNIDHIYTDMKGRKHDADCFKDCPM